MRGESKVHGGRRELTGSEGSRAVLRCVPASVCVYQLLNHKLGVRHDFAICGPISCL